VIACLSKGETGPNSLLEAGACGKPAISVRVGIAPELIKHNYNGLLIERTQKSLENALRKIYQDKKLLKEMGRRMRSRVLIDWTCQKNIQGYRRVLD